MAVYTAALSLGFALGPVILNLTGSYGLLPFLVGSVVADCCCGVQTDRICVFSEGIAAAPDHVKVLSRP